ncbi:hypothetical protein TNCV_3186111 [Trichonephila clavipes]|nr:hypothetical protein TNCV_3186111 [Trichonephila clavipes]
MSNFEETKRVSTEERLKDHRKQPEPTRLSKHITVAYFELSIPRPPRKKPGAQQANKAFTKLSAEYLRVKKEKEETQLKLCAVKSNYP